MAVAPATNVVGVGEGRSNRELLHDALDGDRDAWDSLVDQYIDLLWWIARSYRLDDATAADVVQTVWLQLVRHGWSISDPERLAPWLATTARREAARRVAADRRLEPTDTFEDHPAVVAQPDESLIEAETSAVALAAFHLLSDQCRRLLAALCDVPPQSYQEVSALLGVPIGSIGPTRRRCITALRTEMHGMGYR